VRSRRKYPRAPQRFSEPESNMQAFQTRSICCGSAPKAFTGRHTDLILRPIYSAPQRKATVRAGEQADLSGEVRVDDNHSARAEDLVNIAVFTIANTTERNICD
jgi:hypothetical protein